jgi:hypothetical protein
MTEAKRKFMNKSKEGDSASVDAIVHTPGPWFADGASVRQHSETGLVLCDGGWVGRTRSQSQQDADARVMAAAPELLASCKALLDMIDDAQNGARHTNPVSVYSRASDAIKAAEGV